MSGFRFHDLRHTFRTLGAHAGVPLEVMMAQVGHMDRETSLEYVHIQTDALRRAQQLMEGQQTQIMETVRKMDLPKKQRSETEITDIDGDSASASAANKSLDIDP